MMTPRRTESSLGSTLLLIIGISMVLATVLLHWVMPEQHSKIEMVPLLVGFALALAAAYWKNPRKAREMAEGVTSTGDRVVDSWTRLRSGKRRTDPVVDILRTSDPTRPSDPPQTEVRVTTEDAPGPPPVSGHAGGE